MAEARLAWIAILGNYFPRNHGYSHDIEAQNNEGWFDILVRALPASLTLGMIVDIVRRSAVAQGRPFILVSADSWIFHDPLSPTLAVVALFGPRTISATFCLRCMRIWRARPLEEAPCGYPQRCPNQVKNQVKSLGQVRSLHMQTKLSIRLTQITRDLGARPRFQKKMVRASIAQTSRNRRIVWQQKA